jgi:hypothetical protein
MSWDELLKAVLVVGPGFVLLKVLYLFGGQHKRLEWEWAVWSVIASLPIAAASAGIVGAGQAAGISGPFPKDGIEAAIRFALALVIGPALAFAWYRIRRSDRENFRVFRRYLEDSAWDFALFEAAWRDRGVEVIVDAGDREAHFYGSIDTYGQESAGAEPWVYLTYVYEWRPDVGFVPVESEGDESPETVGYLFHKDQIKRMRFTEAKPDRTSPAILTGVDRPNGNAPAR